MAVSAALHLPGADATRDRAHVVADRSDDRCRIAVQDAAAHLFHECPCAEQTEEDPGDLDDGDVVDRPVVAPPVVMEVGGCDDKSGEDERRLTDPVFVDEQVEQLLDKALCSLKGMLDLGVTTVECKSGYGLETATELKQLQIYRQLNDLQPVELIPTFLGAHMVPDEYQQDRETYIRLLCEVLIPQVSELGLARFCDVLVENGAFTLTEARIILKTARLSGLGLKVHADQLSNGGGAQLAASLGAVSAEHLEYADAEGISALAQAGTVAVSLPLASLYLNEQYIPAREMLNAGVRVAIATDFNPGSAPSYHLPLAMTLACLNQGMTPQEAIMGATTVAARAVSAEQRIGSLLPGYDADIAIIDTPSVNHWLYHFRANACCAVIKSGNWQRKLR